jgi:uncharacterized protein
MAMKLFERINQDMKVAMLSKDKDRLETLRSVKSAFLIAKTEKGASHDLTEEAEMKIIQKLLKQRKDSAEIYQQQKRNDLYEKEMMEASILAEYLPVPMSDEELNKALMEIISEMGAKTMADLGKVMSVATKKLAGKADGKLIAASVRGILENNANG